ncbi:MAG: hypothetical protein ABWW66_02610 [Archaeoglobaceae archaeon]
MKRILLLLLVLALFGCVQKVEEVRVVELGSCDCHQLAKEYAAHTEADCLTCHYVEKHPDVGRPIGECSECHETNLVSIHEPNYGCTLCHGDVRSIHEDSANKYVEGGR